MKILQVVQKPQRRGAGMLCPAVSPVSCGPWGTTSGPRSSIRMRAATRCRWPKRIQCWADRNITISKKIPGLHPVLLWRLIRLIAQWKPDVVQVNGGRTLKYGSAASWYRSHPWVLISRSIGQPRRWLRGRLQKEFYARLVMPRVHGVVAVSSATLQGLTELYKTRGTDDAHPPGGRSDDAGSFVFAPRHPSTDAHADGRQGRPLCGEPHGGEASGSPAPCR